MRATSCGFESHLRHTLTSLQTATFSYGWQKAPGIASEGFGSGRAAVGYERASSIAAAAWSRIFGSTWEYVSRVMAMVEWPSISETILGFTFLASSRVAQVCRRSWKRISWSPARFSSGLNFSLVTARLSSGSPVSEANMRPSASPGLHREPTSIYLRKLALQVALEDLCSLARELHAPPRACRLRGREDGTALGYGERPPDLKRAVFEVHVIPLQAE